MALYMKHHPNLDGCIQDAIEYEDNCDRQGSSANASTSATSMSQVEQSIQEVVERMQILYKLPCAQEYRVAKSPYTCGICGISTCATPKIGHH